VISATTEAFATSALFLKDLAREGAASAEKARRTSPEFVAALRSSGLGSMGIPTAVGGPEPRVTEILDVIETIARGDGSAGWVTMIFATSAVGAHYLDDEALAEIFGEGGGVLMAGVLAPRGTVHRHADGFSLSGRWPFASGSVDADWIGLGALDEDGRPRSFVIPMREVEIIDTWDVIGLRATASHDVAVRDCPVPSRRMIDLSSPPRTDEAPARFPIYGLLAAGIGAVCLGVARAAIDELIELAGGKVPTGSKRRLADRGAVQEAVGRAEALIGSARSYLMGSAAGSAHPATIEDRARLRAASTHAVDASRQAIDLMYTMAGGTSVYGGSRLQRHLRDVHTATQHMMVAQPTWELAGRVLLGLETDTSQL
jgi:alkylation response protein AidB-like acyl-CoA dehydrogenase